MEDFMLSVCLIVKNEIDVLKRCIDSVKTKLNDVVDDIVIIDTGSDDGTIDLIKSLDCRLYHFKWCNDFAAARNYSLSIAKNEWVLVLDADEFVVDVEITNIDEMLNNNKNAIFEINIVNYGDFEGGSYSVSKVPRIFNKSFVSYKGIIHEEPFWLYDKGELLTLPITIHHTGYIDSVVEKKQKANRNIMLLKESLKDNENYYLRMQLAKSFMRKEKYKEAIENLEMVVFNESCRKYDYYVTSIIEYIRCLLNLKQNETALIFEKFWDRCCDNDEYKYYMGHVYMRCKLYEKSVDCFGGILEKEKTQISKVMVMYSLGQLFYVIGIYDESIKYFEMCGSYSNSLENIKAIKELI